MIIECPNCGTKYTVREEAIKPRGRTVRCSTCGQQWHADGAPPVVVEETFEEEPLQTDFAADEPTHEEDDEHREDVHDNDLSHEDFEADLATHAEPDDGEFRAVTPQVRRESQAVHPPKLPTAMILAASVALIMLGLVAAHGPLARAWPATDRVYRAIGLATSAPGEGLQLQNVHAVFDPGAKGKGLTIQAEIVNTLPGPCAVPILTASPQPQIEGGKVFTINSGVAQLPARGTVSIKTSFEAQGLSAEKILLTFSPDNPADSR